MNTGKSEEKEFEEIVKEEPKQSKEIEVQVKPEEAEKKRRQFFTATVFDEEKSQNDNSKFDDDILNVPAFFRRKK